MSYKSSACQVAVTNRHTYERVLSWAGMPPKITISFRRSLFIIATNITVHVEYYVGINIYSRCAD